MPRETHVRVEFTKAHDKYLIQYLGTYCPTKEGRSGRKTYQTLVEDPNKLWPFAKHHTWQSWRERYVKNSERFDAAILRYQEKNNMQPMKPVIPQKRIKSVEKLSENAKRVRRDEEEETPTEQTHGAMQPERASSSNSRAKSRSKHDLEPPETPTKTPQPVRDSKATHARKASHTASPARPNANNSMSATKKPAMDVQTQQGTFGIPSPSPDRQFPSPIEITCSPHRFVKRLRVRPGTPSDIFVSQPPSPSADAALPAVYPRAPPCIVDSFHGQVLVDQKGHKPRAFPPDDRENGAEEVEDKPDWPPVRGHTTKPSSTNGPDVEHHAFSQSQSQFESEKTEALAAQASPVAAEPLDEADARKNDASPIKRLIKAARPSNSYFARRITGHLPKVFKFPAPRASTRSPFRPDASPKEPQAQSPTKIKAARHPALSRIRRQATGHVEGNESGHEPDHQRDVPSVDLVALSSVSSRSHSHSSPESSVPARPPRWSLPAYVHATPWVFDERGAPSTVHVHNDPWGHARTSSSPTVYTPPPARSPAGTSSSASLTPHAADLELVTLHGLASILARMSANHGLALHVVEAVYKRVGSLREADEVLKGMREAAEGYGEREIVRRVKARRAARASMGSGDKGQRQCESGSGTSQLRYVVTSDDGEGSEYSPPETSRAAMWKRKSESASAMEKASEEEEEAEGREVEEELRNRDGEDDSIVEQPMDVDDEEGDLDEETKRLEDALVQDTRFAEELEEKLGKGQYRRAIAKMFSHQQPIT